MGEHGKRGLCSLLAMAMGSMPCALSVAAQHDCSSAKGAHAWTPTKGGTLWPMDILHQHIVLDLTPATTIRGACTIRAVPRLPGTTVLPLHLKALAVDSVVGANGLLPWTHTDELLEISLPTALGPTDTLELTVHYGGAPVLDPSGFGGFYFSGQYRYNLGVAFQNVPHSFGRAWFPCVDNFTERNTYSFAVKTHAGRRAWCNGELIGETILGGDTVVRHWRIGETMPAYLASVAAADYAVLRDTFPSIGGPPVPVELVARAPDTTNLRNSFVNLPQAFACFEHWFGRYRWNKVGYVVTPQGAMEHSTSIHYPRSIVNGNLQYEDVMAHELAHQWFGDLVTCERAEEMYINEGFAEYLSHLFLEWVYGPARYRSEVRTNHRRMVHRAHLLDEGWWALAEVPQAHTYGEHSYRKGADVLHTLRSYMGDEAFRTALTSFLDVHAFQPVNSTMLRDHLQQVSGVPLQDFFDDWVFQPGWAAFEVDSFHVGAQLPGGGFPVEVFVQQKQRGPAQPYHNVPLTVSCISSSGERWHSAAPLMAGGDHCVLNLNAPFVPQWVSLNLDERISLAVTQDKDTLTTLTSTTYNNTDIRIQALALPEPVYLEIEEYWVGADPGTTVPFTYVVSPDRWWRITGRIPQGTSLAGRINYDGRATNTASYDVGLMQDFGGVAFREDSLVLLYRPDQRHPWALHPNFTVSTLTSPTDKTGRIDFTGVWAGEYALAWRYGSTGLPEGHGLGGRWTLRPNPANGRLWVEHNGTGRTEGTLRLLNGAGQVVRTVPWTGSPTLVPLEGLPAATYPLFLADRKGRMEYAGAVVVE